MQDCLFNGFYSVSHIQAFRVGELLFDAPVFARVSQPGSRNDYSRGKRIPLLAKTFKYADKVATTAAGRIHSVSMTWESTVAHISDISVFNELELYPHDIVIHYLSGYSRIVRTDEDAYAFAYEEQDGSYKCTLKLTNGQGLIDNSEHSFT